MGQPLSNLEFGRKVGVSASVASRIRSGKHQPTLPVMLAIANEFHIPLHDLVPACVAGGEQQARIMGDAVPRVRERTVA